MARKATFAVKNPKPSSSAHNSREIAPKYLIEPDPSFDKNYYEKMANYESDVQLIRLAKTIYKKKIKQKMQAKQLKALIKETVITANEEHTSDDIKGLFDVLGKEMGGGYHLLELSGHFDEGHFVRIEKGWENLTYYPGKDILLKGDGNWYIKSDELSESTEEGHFDTLADMSLFRKVYNIHWHAKFTHMNLETGKTARFTKGQVSGEGRLKFVADFLGLRYEPKSKIPRAQGVGSIKEQHRAKRTEKYRQIIEKRIISMDHKQELTKADWSLKASMANHKSDSNAAFIMNVEYEAEKRERACLEEHINDLEEEVEAYENKTEDLFSVLNIVLEKMGHNAIQSDGDIEELKKSIECDMPLEKENEVEKAAGSLIETVVDEDLDILSDSTVRKI